MLNHFAAHTMRMVRGYNLLKKLIEETSLSKDDLICIHSVLDLGSDKYIKPDSLKVDISEKTL